MKRSPFTHAWWITMVLAVAMLVAHSLSYTAIKVDNTSIILLIVIFLSPLASAITKIKFGEFEAEIKPAEVQKVTEAVSSREKQLDKTTEVPEIENAINVIGNLVESDPVLALAKLRIELESMLNKLYRITYKERQPERPLSAGLLADRLASVQVLPPDIGGPIREVISICNRAIHGEEIRQRDAKSVVQTGSILLRDLFSLIAGYAIKPVESSKIDQTVVQEFTDAKYRVTTIVPLVRSPLKNVYILDQHGLDEFLEGYNEYAEFIVEVTRIPS